MDGDLNQSDELAMAIGADSTAQAVRGRAGISYADYTRHPEFSRCFTAGSHPDDLAFKCAVHQSSDDGVERVEPGADCALFPAGAQLDIFSCRSVCGDSIVSGDHGY